MGDDPIAVIGMGCRFPGGADSPDAFWSLLHRGVDAVAEVPANRWDTRQALPACCSGGFLHRVDEFEPQFFRIKAVFLVPDLP